MWWAGRQWQRREQGQGLGPAMEQVVGGSLPSRKIIKEKRGRVGKSEGKQRFDLSLCTTYVCQVV